MNLVPESFSDEGHVSQSDVADVWTATEVGQCLGFGEAGSNLASCGITSGSEGNPTGLGSFAETWKEPGLIFQSAK